MFRVLYRDLKHSIKTRESTTIHFSNLYNVVVVLQKQNPHFKTISQTPEPTIPPSFTVNYLINSCGLPPEKAYSAAEKIRLRSTENPDSVISLFKNHGFTKTQISVLISKRPSLLLSDTNNNLKPKLEFFSDSGFFSCSELANLIASTPELLLTGSLQNKIIPSFNFLKSYIGDKASILTIFKRWPKIFDCNLEMVVRPNISIFQDHGVPDINIVKLFITYPRTLGQKPDRFKEIIDTVKKLGFDPSTQMFQLAFRIIAGMSKSSLDKKLAVFRELGWSEDDILSMIKKNPCCVAPAGEKIKRGLEFFMEKYKWKPADFMLQPWLFSLSLEKRVIPRCAVLEILKSKGISEKLKVTTILKRPEKEFVEKYVNKYQEEIPEVMIAYKCEIGFEGFGEVGGAAELSVEAGEDHVTTVEFAA
ncbi:Mitochodrial transcription termination factor-related [Macleaya cordata]|uniref:Mitochodrial transcription termination factor-related n=1 Tax=Macleaya cordata TaxID=56857 RepID=A0A200Q1J3_MACCD|nr:Mitochodrial transcription termination factor-related [Macleaya cordata]